MTGKTHLWPEEPVRSGGAVTAGVVVEGPQHDRVRIWYRVPERYGGLITASGDPYVLVMLFTAMRIPTDLHMHGEVSPSLLRNLDEFQAAWACWRPERYVKVEITADAEREHPCAGGPGSAVTLFSGGVDSSFTAYRYRNGLCGRQNLDLEAGLMIHGFDIPLESAGAFHRAAERAEGMVKSLGIEFISMATNLRDLGEPWWDMHGAAPASCLSLLQRGFAAGIIPSTEPYNGLVLPWGSNPVTDWMLSGDSFRIIHDGASFSRVEKVGVIAEWKEALQHLRVCMIGKEDEEDRNCNVCEKCIRTILNFRVLGLALPGCFEHDASDSQIAGLRGLDALKIAELQRVLTYAKRRSLTASWVRALQVCLVRNQLRLKLRKTARKLRNTIPFLAP
ncbi:MAG: hypothetical protein U0411_06245 [Thermodesulfovibrionales bacterium]